MGCLLRLVLGLVIGVVVGGAIVYVVTEEDDDPADQVNVTVREGLPPLGDGIDVVVLVANPIVESAIMDALASADLPVTLEDVTVTAVREGFQVEGNAVISAAGIDLEGPFTSLAVPVAAEDGRVGVELAGTRVRDVAVPGAIEAQIADYVSPRVAEATAFPGYAVRAVETSETQLIISLAREP